MAKSKPSREYLYSWGKWQALRRNPEYRKDWNDIKQGLLTRFEFCEKWDISHALHPDYTYDHLKQFGTYWVKLVWSAFGLEYRPVSKAEEEEKAIGAMCTWLQPFNRRAVTWADRSEYDKLTVRLDLKFSSKKILEEVEELLQLHRKQKNIINTMAAASGHEVGPEKKPVPWHPHYDNVENYFLVYKLKKEEGKSWSEIADILRERGHDTVAHGGLVQVARNHYKAARLLIKRGFDCFPDTEEGGC